VFGIASAAGVTADDIVMTAKHVVRIRRLTIAA
jgi:hypothetical protein